MKGIFHSVLQDDQNFWNAMFSIGFVFLAFFLGGFVYIADEGYPRSIDWFDALILSLATFRLVRLFVYDKVTAWIRALFADATSGPRKPAYDLLLCPWCFGVWAALFVCFFYYTMPMAWFFLLVLAIAGVGSFFQLLANMIGWKAELGKLEAQSFEK